MRGELASGGGGKLPLAFQLFAQGTEYDLKLGMAVQVAFERLDGEGVHADVPCESRISKAVAHSLWKTDDKLIGITGSRHRLRSSNQGRPGADRNVTGTVKPSF